MDAKQTGSGSIGDVGSHVIDLARHLMGEIVGVSALAVRSNVGPEPAVVRGFLGKRTRAAAAFGELQLPELPRFVAKAKLVSISFFR